MAADDTLGYKGARFSLGGRQASLARVAPRRMLAPVDTISVWRFEELGGAEIMLRDVSAEDIDDAALVRWPPDRRMPSTRHVGAIDGPGALWWGGLLGVVFPAPHAGPAPGAARCGGGSCSAACPARRTPGRRSAPPPARWPAGWRTSVSATTSSCESARPSRPARPPCSCCPIVPRRTGSRSSCTAAR